MRDPGLAHLSGATGLHIVELIADESTDDHLSQLSKVHNTYFDSYTNVVSEIAQFRIERSESLVTRHVWLVLDGDTAVGEIIFHTSHQFKIGVMHFVAMQENVRQRLNLGWFNSLIEAVELSAQFDLHRDGLELSALIAEIPYEDLSRWERVGFRYVDVGYLEPHHGRSWKLHGEPTFFSMSPVVRIGPKAAPHSFGAIAISALSAFLIEHYDLDPEHPEVARILKAATLIEE